MDDIPDSDGASFVLPAVPFLLFSRMGPVPMPIPLLPSVRRPHRFCSENNLRSRFVPLRKSLTNQRGDQTMRFGIL